MTEPVISCSEFTVAAFEGMLRGEERVEGVALYVLGRTAESGRHPLLKEIRNRQNGPALQRWLRQTARAIGVDANQALAPHKCMAGALFPFPYQKVPQGDRWYAPFQAEKHEQTLLQGLEWLFGFLDEGMELSSLQQAIVLRVLTVHQPVKSTPFRQWVIDWNGARADSLLKLFNPLVTHEGRTSPDPDAVSFKTYVFQRFINEYLPRTLSKRVKDAIEERMTLQPSILFDLAYYLHHSDYTPQDRPSTPIIEALKDFSHYGDDQPALFDLLYFRDQSRTYPQIPSPKTAETLDLVSDYAPYFLCLDEKHHFALFCFFLQHLERDWSHFPFEELTIPELLRWTPAHFRRFAGRAQAFDLCAFTPTQTALLSALPNPSRGITFLTRFYRALELPPDRDFCFHFLMHELEGSREMTTLQDLYALSAPLPELYRPTLPLQFPMHQSPPGDRRTPIVRTSETLQVMGAELLFSGELPDPRQKRACELTLFDRGALVEEGQVITYAQAYVDWGDRDSVAILELFPDRTIPTSAHSTVSGSFQDALIQRTLAALQKTLGLSFSERTETALAKDMENERVRLDLAFWPHQDDARTWDMNRDSRPWLVAIRTYYRLQRYGETCEELGLLFDYATHFGEVQEFRTLAPLKERWQYLQPLMEQFPDGGEKLVGLYLREPEAVLREIASWPLNALRTPEQLIRIVANKQKLKRDVPFYSHYLTLEELRLVHMMSKTTGFQERHAFIRELFPHAELLAELRDRQKEENARRREFTFAFLMSTIDLGDESPRIIEAIQRGDHPDAIERFQRKGLERRELAVGNLFIDLLNPPCSGRS